MATSLTTKTGTNIAETSQEEALKLSALSQKAGMVPRTPAGAAAIGANPDQQKMVGTPAQKPARVEGAQKDKLDATQRVSAPTTEGVASPDKLERMRQLGTLNTQVEGLVQGYMQQLQSQQAALGLNQTTLGAIDQTKRPALETALNKYKSALTEQEKEAAVIEAGNALGRPLTPQELQGYFAGTPEQVGALAKAVTPEGVSLRDLNLASAGVNLQQLAADLGASEDELAGLSLPQLNQKIAELQQQSFAEAAGKEAEALSAVGNRAKQLQMERQALGQSGVKGYEQQFDQLKGDIENAATVSVGGRELTIDELLQNEELSKIVADASISEASLQKLEQTEPALAAWVRTYKSALAQLSADAGLVAQDVVATQQEAEGLKGGVSQELFGKLFGEQADIMSGEQLQQLKAAMQGSALWQAMSQDSQLKTRLEGSPESVDMLKNMDSASIKQIMDATKLAEAMPVMQDLLGYTPGGILTPQQTDFVNMWKDELQALPNSITDDPNFKKMIKDGTIGEGAASLLAADPTLWDDVRREQAAQAELKKVDDEGEFLEMLTGTNQFTLDDFNESMDNLKAWAATGDEKALSYYIQLKKALTGPDGKLDLNDVKKALQDMQAAGLGAADVINGKQGVDPLIKKLGAVIMKSKGYADMGEGANAKRLVIEYLKDDEKIDANEMNKILASPGGAITARKLLDEPWLPNKQELAGVYNSRVKADTAPTLKSVAEGVKSIPGMSNINLNPDGSLPFKKDAYGRFALAGYDYGAASNFRPEEKALYLNSLTQLRDAYSNLKGKLVGDNSYARSAAALDIMIKRLQGGDKYVGGAIDAVDGNFDEMWRPDAAL